MGNAMWIALVLVACCVSTLGAAESESMSNYEIDPNAPCGARCQIKRAMQAWGGLVKADPNKLLHKFRQAATNNKAVKALQKMTINIEQRLDAAERRATKQDSPCLKAMRKNLRLQ